MARVAKRCPPVLPEPLEGRSLLSAGVVIIDDGPRPPTAFLAADDLQPAGGRVRGGAGPHVFALAFDDDKPMDESSVRDNPYALRVVGPNDYEAAPRLVGTGGARLSEFDSLELYYFEMPAPGGRWDPADDGKYVVHVNANQIKDADGNFVPEGDVGTISAAIPGHGPDLRAAAEVRSRKAARPGSRLPVRVTLSNLGDGRLRGEVDVVVGLVPAGAAPGSTDPLAARKDRFFFRTTLHAGKTKRFTLRLGVPPGLAPGEYRLVVSAQSRDEIETDAFNNGADGETIVVQAS